MKKQNQGYCQVFKLSPRTSSPTHLTVFFLPFLCSYARGEFPLRVRDKAIPQFLQKVTIRKIAIVSRPALGLLSVLDSCGQEMYRNRRLPGWVGWIRRHRHLGRRAGSRVPKRRERPQSSSSFVPPSCPYGPPRKPVKQSILKC